MENTKELQLPNRYSLKISCKFIKCDSITRDMFIKALSMSEDEARDLMHRLATHKCVDVGSYYKDIAASRIYRLLKIATDESMDIDAKLVKKGEEVE